MQGVLNSMLKISENVLMSSIEKSYLIKIDRRNKMAKREGKPQRENNGNCQTRSEDISRGGS